MEKMNIKELALACNGVQISGKSDSVIEGIVIDSRNANSTNVFVAIIGENLDGHRFIGSAYENGCRTFIISDKNIELPFNKDVVNIIMVKDTQLAIGYIGTYYKEKFNIPYVGVTGSVGKTTTRDMIYSALTGKFDTHKNVGNLNNHLGVPLTLFELNKKHKCAVIEMGMSHFKEIEYLADMVHPQIGVISNIGLSHVENLGSQEGILQAKLEITKNFNKDNILIVNGDDNLLKTLKEKDLSYRLKTFGFNDDNDIYCVNYSMTTYNISFDCKIGEVMERFEIPTVGEHNILNAMSAILVGLELGLTFDEIRIGFKNYTPTGMRLDIVENDRFTIINDCYNASPDSMNSALKVLNSFNGRKVAILGDMFEMGDMAEIGHRQVAPAVVENADILITIGKDSMFIGDESLKLGFCENRLFHFETKDDLYKQLDSILMNDDIVLVKASRGMRLEDVVDKLLK